MQPYNVAKVYGLTALIVYGLVILAAAPVGYYVYRRATTAAKAKKEKAEGDVRESNGIRYLYAFLALPPVFTVISLLVGIGEMAFWFNSRFTILLAPLLMVLAGFYIARQPRKIANNRVLLGGVVAALFAFQFVIAPAFSAVVTLDDAFGGFAYKYPHMRLRRARS